MTWPHFVDFLTVLFLSSMFLLLLGCVHDEFADRRARAARARRTVPHVTAAGSRIPAPRGGVASEHDTRGA